MEGFVNRLHKYWLFGLVLILVMGCASTPQPADTRDYYLGTGRAGGLGPAMSAAKMDAVRNAVIDLIGESAEASNRELLNEILYSTTNPNQFVYAESMETLRRENLGTVDEMDMIYDLRIRVNVPKVRQILEVNGISGDAGGRGLQGGAAADSNPPQTASQSEAQAEEPVFQEPTAQQRQFLQRYLQTMTYMVYYNEEAIADPFLIKAALTQANGYLASQGYTVIFPEQIETLKEDARIAYEEQTGQARSLMQYIAQRLNADVYIEIDGSTTSSTNGSNYYGQAIITLNIFETSTGQLLGSVPYTSPRTLSRVDEFDAVSNALQSSVYQAMPHAVNQSTTVLAKQFEMGIRYEVVLINTPDSRLMSDLRRALRRKVTDVETVAQTAEETRYVIHFYGRVDELEDMMYDTADLIPGLQNLDLVLTRGKTLTFDTGL
ncbi:DUF6175 family protein [Spirochaeta lutea]|uniref:DUF6175 family protein n=1 Tax=Spirochaeta lutea TaxID=1480694 RepID=UPI000689853D|nr:DUF6175 family protein [Spirochaeta lutea]